MAFGFPVSWLNNLFNHINRNRLHFDPQQFDANQSPDGLDVRLRPGQVAADSALRWTVSPVYDNAGNFDGKITLAEGTLYAPINTGTANTAGDPDPGILLMIPAISQVWLFPDNTFPATLNASIGDQAFLQLTWALVAEEQGNNNEEGADIPVVSFWELTDVVPVVSGTRPDPIIDWAGGAASTTLPLATIENDGNGGPLINQHTRADVQATLPILSDRSLIPDTNGSGGGPGTGLPRVTVDVSKDIGEADPADDSRRWVMQWDATGSDCATISYRTGEINYTRYKLVFNNGTTTATVRASKIGAGALGAKTSIADFETCSVGP